MKLMRLSVLTVAAVLAGSLGGAAWGAPPVELQAQSQRVGEPALLSEARPAGKNLHVEFVETLRLTGDITSSAVAQFQCVFVGTKSLVCHGEQVSTGTIRGVDGVGTTTSKVQFRCLLTTGACTGSGTIIDATGAAAGIRGHSTFEANLATGLSDITQRLVLP